MRAHDDRGDPRHAFVPDGYAAVFDVPTKRGLAPHDVLGSVEGQPARHPARLTVAAQAVLEGSLVGIARASGA
jgi:hypothetical protein